MSKKPRFKEQEHKYSAANIKKLDLREHVRHRPGMYVGGIDKKALHNVVFELIERAITSTSIGYCDRLEITLLPDNIIKLEDTDTIIPKELATGQYALFPHEQNFLMRDIPLSLWYKRPIFIEDGGHLIHSGLDHVNIMTLCPLGKYMTIMLCHENQIWKRTYHEGKPHGALLHYTLNQPQPDGVSITFQPDFTIFEPNEFDYDWIRDRCQTLAYLFPQVTISLADERVGKEQSEVFHYPDGIRAMVRDLNRDKSPHHDILNARKLFNLPKYRDNIVIELALQYTDSQDTILRSYVNAMERVEGGTHIDGFRHALMGYINGSNPHPLSWDETARGLTAIIHILHSDPQFESFTTIKLLNPEMFEAIESMMYPLMVDANLRKARHGRA